MSLSVFKYYFQTGRYQSTTASYDYFPLEAVNIIYDDIYVSYVISGSKVI
jgi:hypothetical protein